MTHRRRCTLSFVTCEHPLLLWPTRNEDCSFSSDCIYHFCEGHDATQHAAFGEAVHIAVTLRMHEEASYEGLDLIESEVRRRTFWLLFGGMTQSPRISSFTILNLISSG